MSPVSNLSYNYVMSGYRKKNHSQTQKTTYEPVILKLGLDFKALAKEALCLKLFAKHGAVQLLEQEQGVLLLEKASPGTTLKDYFPQQENKALEIVCNTIKNLQSITTPEQTDLPYLKDTPKTLDKDIDIPQDILYKSRKLADKLLQSTTKQVLLHGDLHHENILKHSNTWLIIDPKGYIGDPSYEICTFIINPIPLLLEVDNPQKIIKHRITQASTYLKIPAQRITSWLYVKNVLCWKHSLDDNTNPKYWIKLVKILNSIIC